MKTIISEINIQIKTAIKNSILKAVESKMLPEMEVPKINVEKPREKNHGDFSSNIAMAVVKQARMAPTKIAQIIIDGLETEGTYLYKAECAGPGFINFFIKDKWLYDTVDMILTLGDEYGSLDYGENKKVMVEYVSANPTGPLHMGNARGAALGDLIANVLSKAGFCVSKEYYVNDAGNQIEKFALSLEARYLQQINGENFIDFPEDGYQGNDIIEHVIKYIEQGYENLTDKSSKYRKQKLAEFALPINIENIRKGLKRYGIVFDVWFSEKSLHDSGEVAETIEFLRKKGHTFEKDGALWIKCESMGSEKDEVLIKSNGLTTYFASDLAYHRNKFIKRKFDWVVNLLGTDHHAHAMRMKNTMTALEISKEKLDFVLFQLVHLKRNGEIVRMSKRTGQGVSLNELLDEVGVDAARFFFNMKASGSHLEFDLDLAKTQSNENPVFYVQYAYARICSMLRILKEDGTDVERKECPPLETLVEKEEKTLMKKLAEYPHEIMISVRTLEPGRLTRYVIDVAAAFHSFYNACRVKGEEETLQKARLALVKATKIVIKNVLEVLSINAPERM